MRRRRIATLDASGQLVLPAKLAVPMVDIGNPKTVPELRAAIFALQESHNAIIRTLRAAGLIEE
jgi:hypothetical protein